MYCVMPRSSARAKDLFFIWAFALINKYVIVVDANLIEPRILGPLITRVSKPFSRYYCVQNSHRLNFLSSMPLPSKSLRRYRLHGKRCIGTFDHCKWNLNSSSYPKYKPNTLEYCIRLSNIARDLMYVTGVRIESIGNCGQFYQSASTGYDPFWYI